MRDKVPILFNTLPLAKVISPVFVVIERFALEKDASVPFKITTPDPPAPA